MVVNKTGKNFSLRKLGVLLNTMLSDPKSTRGDQSAELGLVRGITQNVNLE